MQTVNQSIEIASYVTGISRARVNQIARRLIEANMLPKSSGRDIKRITAAQFLPLLAATALAENVADAPRVARAFAELPVRVGDQDSADEPQFLPHFFERAMTKGGGWTKTAIEFARTAAGFTATLAATIASDATEIEISIPFFESPSWGHFCKTSFAISPEGVEVMRNLFARDDIEGMSFKLAGRKAGE